jgi:hypothetical protein
MSWDKTYSHNLLIALDQFGAAVIFNHPDLTISTLCRIVQLADDRVEDFPARLESLRLSRWQLRFLRWLAPKLDQVQSSHCELSRRGDLQRADSTSKLLRLAAANQQP